MTETYYQQLSLGSKSAINSQSSDTIVLDSAVVQAAFNTVVYDSTKPLDTLFVDLLKALIESGAIPE